MPVSVGDTYPWRHLTQPVGHRRIKSAGVMLLRTMLLRDQSLDIRTTLKLLRTAPVSHTTNYKFWIIYIYVYIDTHTHTHTHEGWNFNYGNAAVTFGTAHLQSSYFHRPSMYSPKLCRTRSQRWGGRMMPLATPVLLMVRTERSTAEGLNPPCNCPIR